MASAAMLFKAAGVKTLCSCGQAGNAPARPRRSAFRALPRPLFEGSGLGRFHSKYRVGSGLRRFSPKAEISRGRAESNGDDSVPQAEQVKKEAQGLKLTIKRVEKEIKDVENKIETAAKAGESTEFLQRKEVALREKEVALREKEVALEQRLTALAQAEVEKLKLQQTPGASSVV
jgi:hypothetical protein